ncbi:MAG: copper amine oxidase N-terminal domain-containing protein [Clostridiales bacterium]|nr:MAG: copper amine oxidase N-terminal domain-containing protein [Clostridiales bacterium]
MWKTGGRLVPVRAVSEHSKYSVEWFAEEQRVDIDSPSDKLTLYIGSADYYKKTVKKRTMDVPAVIKDERTFVPLRLVAEELGCEVKWDEENNIVNVIKI